MGNAVIELFKKAQKEIDWLKKTEYHPFPMPKMRAWHKKNKRIYDVLTVSMEEFGGVEVFEEWVTDFTSGEKEQKTIFFESDDVELLPQSPLKLSTGEYPYFGDFVQVSLETYRLFESPAWKKEEWNPIAYLIMYRADIMGWGTVDLKDLWLAGGNPYYANAHYLWLIKHDKESKIIGNMFENPELMGKDHVVKY